MEQCNWNYPTNIRFGAGRIEALPSFCHELGFKKPLMVVDGFIAEQDFFKTLCEQLKAEDITTTLFTDFAANPSDKDICNRHNADKTTSE